MTDLGRNLCEWQVSVTPTSLLDHLLVFGIRHCHLNKKPAPKGSRFIMLLSDREISLSKLSLRLTQQRQYRLRSLVGLRQNRSTGLLENVSAGHVGHFLGVISVFYT